MTPPPGPELVDQLEAKIRVHIIGKMGDPSGELGQMRLGSLIIRWLNWRDRFIAVRPRSVHESKELLASLEATTYATEMATIKSEIEAGADLSLRLSNRVNTPYVATTSQDALHQRADLDLLLSDWGIHHLHLVPAPARSGSLLFGVFRPDDAYLLLILDHTAWTDISLVEVVVRNWSSEGLVLGPINGLALSHAISGSDRKKFRQAGVATPVQVDGRLYLPRGLTTGGTSVDTTQRSNVIVWTLRQLRDELAQDHQALDNLAQAQGLSITDLGEWHPTVTDNAFGYFDAVSGVALDVIKLV